MEHTTELKTIADLKALNEDSKLQLGAYYQRAAMAAWAKPERTDALLDSILRGWHIQPIHATKDAEGNLIILDGKQRITTIFRILTDATIESDEQIAGLYNLKGKNYPMFPEAAKKSILNYQLEFVIHNSLDDDQILVYFERLQKGIPLSIAQSKRGSYIKRLLETGLVKILADAEPIKVKNAQDWERIALQMYQLEINTAAPGWKGSEYITQFNATQNLANATANIKTGINRLARVINTAESDDEKKTLKRIRKAVHLPTLVYALAHLPSFADPSPDGDPAAEDAWYNLLRFFKPEADARTEERRAYDTAAAADSASSGNVIKRRDTMIKVLSAARPRIVETHTPAQATDSTEAKRKADAEHAEKEKAKAAKKTAERIEADKAAKAAANAPAPTPHAPGMTIPPRTDPGQKFKNARNRSR